MQHARLQRLSTTCTFVPGQETYKRDRKMGDRSCFHRDHHTSSGYPHDLSDKKKQKTKRKPCEALGICFHIYSIHLIGSWRVLWKVCSYLYMLDPSTVGKVYQSWKGWYYHIHSCNGRRFFFSEIWGENRECGHYTGKKRHFFFANLFDGTCLYWTTVLACTGSGYSWLFM